MQVITIKMLMSVATYVPFIPNNVLEAEVLALLTAAQNSVSPTRNINKNKVDPLNAKAKLALYDEMHALISPTVSQYHGYTAYLVEMISTKNIKQNRNGKDFTPSDSSTKSRRAVHSNIKCISGKHFYSKITNIPNALDMLFDALPAVIQKVSPYPYRFSRSDINAMMQYYNSAC
jgi:hypothetical protein